MRFDETDVRRCRCVSVPSDLSSNVHAARGDADIAWLAVFEDELALALADYGAYRADGTPTHELADYIAYLDACVACLSAGGEAGFDGLAAIERFARVKRTATA